MVSSERLPAVRLRAPEWFERPDFAALVTGEGHPATWHTGGALGEYSDVFTVWDHAEGPDSEVIPADIWAAIGAACTDAGLSYAVVWISPC